MLEPSRGERRGTGAPRNRPDESVNHGSMERRRIRIGLDVGAACIRIVAVEGDDQTTVWQSTVPIWGPLTSAVEQHSTLGRGNAPGTMAACSGDRVEATLRSLRTALAQLIEGTRLDPADVSSVTFGTTWGTLPLGPEDVTVGLLIIGSPLATPKLSPPSRDALPPLLKVAPLRLDAGQVETAAAWRNLLYDLRSRGVKAIVVADETPEGASPYERAFLSASASLSLPALRLRDMGSLPPGDSSSTLPGEVTSDLLVRLLTLASFLPRLFRLADGVEKALRARGVTAPLFVLTDDGRAVTLDKFREQPGKSLFSGHVAGVLGGFAQRTPTEEALVVNVGSATTLVAVGRHHEAVGQEGGPTRLPRFVWETLAFGGESLIRVSRGTIASVGPRTIYDFNIPPAWMVPAAELMSARLTKVIPEGNDGEYVLLETAENLKIGLTATCAAVVLGLFDSADMGEGRRWPDSSIHSARMALQYLGDRLALRPEDVAEIVLRRAADRLGEKLQALLRKHRLDRSTVIVTIGGGAPLVARFLRENQGLKVIVPTDHEYCGAFGLAHAELPSPEECETLATSPFVAPDQRVHLVAQAMMTEESRIKLLAETARFEVYEGTCQQKQFFGLRSSRQRKVIVCEKDGTIRLRLGDASVLAMTAEEAPQAIPSFLRWAAGKNRGLPFPLLYLLHGHRIVDLCRLNTLEQVMRLVRDELQGVNQGEHVILLAEGPSA